MKDRELLELAAKAAGIWDDSDPSSGLLKGTGQYWNPLVDDGDALRLAVKLEMQVYVGSHTVVAEILSDSDEPSIWQKVFVENDPYAATRRAIVRAAAELGRAMENKK